MKVRLLKDISWEYLNTGEHGEVARKYIDSFYRISERANLPKGIAIANYQYAVLGRQQGNYRSALESIQKYLDFWKGKERPQEMAHGLYQKALIQVDIGNFQESLKLYHEILRIYEMRKDTFSMATTLNSLGEVLKMTGRANDAMKSYSHALALFDSLDNKRQMANCVFNIGDTYLIFNEYDKALEYFSRALELDREISSEWGIAYDYESLGKVHSLMGNFETALDHHRMALEIREHLQLQPELALSYYELGKNELALKNYEQARQFLNNATEINEKIGVKSALKDNYQALSRLYEETGNLTQALNFRDKFIAINDTLYNEAKSRQIEELMIQFDTEKKQAAIASLEKDAQITDLQLKRQTTYRNITIGVSLMLLILGFVVFNRYKFRQKILSEKQEKLRLIAEEKRKTEMEKRRVQELKQIDKLKDEFLANTSHELRTPLHGIIGLTESLKDGIAGKLPKKAQENLDMISRSGKRLAHLVNDLLDFSKLKHSDLELNIQPVDVHAVVDIILALSQPLAQGKKLTLINLVPQDVAVVEADENRLQQILHNLVGNAIKFTEKGEIQVRCEEKNGELFVSVSDTGIGIAEDQKDRIFNAFEQIDGSERRVYGGTGLGLSITRQLVELHGGRILVSSTPGVGTTFTFTLPVSRDSRANLKAKSPSLPTSRLIEDRTPLKSEPHSLRNARITSDAKHILIIDDEPINRQVLTNHLHNAGYRVSEAATGKDGVEILNSDPSIDLVLLDIMMPGMSGLDVCEQIRKKYLPSELPVVLLTAKNRVSDLVNAFNLGANDYLTKPFSKSELLSRIKTHLHLKGIHKAASKFVPIEFIKSVGREAITDVLLGDHVEKEVTVLFSDIRDYTTLAESMSPHENFKFVNSYVGKMGPIIKNHQGFVNQYFGDGIMALFPDNAAQSLQAAVDMQQELARYNTRRKKAGKIELTVGIGLHTGPLVMGIIGDNARNDTAIISDTVNTASRVEGLTKHYGANILLSETSIYNIRDITPFGIRYLGKVRVKGKDKALGIFECFDGDDIKIRKLKFETQQKFEKGLKLFFDSEFPRATAIFDNILRTNPDDKVAKYFVSRAAQYTLSGTKLENDIINTMTEK